MAAMALGIRGVRRWRRCGRLRRPAPDQVTGLVLCLLSAAGSLASLACLAQGRLDSAGLAFLGTVLVLSALILSAAR